MPNPAAEDCDAGIAGNLHHVDDRPSASLMFLDDALHWSDNVIPVLDQSGWKRDADPCMALYSGELGVSFSSMPELRKADGGEVNLISD